MQTHISMDPVRPFKTPQAYAAAASITLAAALLWNILGSQLLWKAQAALGTGLAQGMFSNRQMIAFIN